ncbi:S1 family peptidase [Thermococcus barophilus]|uniref:Putative protease n=1 Tax=Thermococcus barophilus TaxID=55802 RepID=A0A0S1XBV1_THEBA|nr:S1 family peptidase [Thermococcus barophilus]ALM75228.1 putative protease [Thermococcus barophilus]
MQWKLLSVLLLGLLVLSSFGSAEIGSSDKGRACQLVSYWVFENGRWVEKSEPRVWWYCQEPEKAKDFDGFAFKEIPYGLFKKPDVKILHQAARDLTDLVGINELHGKLSTNLPSYGGMFINEEKGLIFVYVKDKEDKEKIKQALGKYKGKVNIVFLKGKYSFEQLVKWKEKARELFRIKELEVTMLDADEAHNTLTIGLADVTSEKLKLLENELEKLGIPKEAVRIEQIKRTKFTSLIGGTKITVSGGGTCTLGYTAKINGQNYAVTAGHCGEFGISGQSVYQNSNYIGWVYKNPPGTVTFDPETGLYFRERKSDSMLIKVVVPIDNMVYPYWRVAGASIPRVGTYVCKRGITTGETCGTITRVGTDLWIGGNTQEEVVIIHDAFQAPTMDTQGGDSGSPVYYKIAYDEIVIVGIVSAEDGWCSGMEGIFDELGYMQLSWE